MGLAAAILIPLIISGVCFYLFHTITWKEFLLQVVLLLVFCISGWQIAKWGALQSSELLNGRVIAKTAGTQKCCHCSNVCVSTDKDGNCTSTVEVCSHGIDYYWDLETSVGTVGIESCSGYDSPPAVWTSATVGDPASKSHIYTNYLLADENSLLVHSPVEQYAGQIPEYPQVHTYYMVDHIVGNVTPPVALQEAMRALNADLGSSNQVDITLLLTTIKDPTYAQAVEAQWLYGPKNSLTVVAGLQGDVVQWVRVVTFSKVEMLKVRLRDQLQGLSINDPKFMATLRTEIGSGFRRTAMSEFAYLASNAAPKGWMLALLLFLEAAFSAGLAYWSHVKDIFGDEYRQRSWRY